MILMCHLPSAIIKIKETMMCVCRKLFVSRFLVARDDTGTNQFIFRQGLGKKYYLPYFEFSERNVLFIMALFFLWQCYSSFEFPTNNKHRAQSTANGTTLHHKSQITTHNTKNQSLQVPGTWYVLYL